MWETLVVVVPLVTFAGLLFVNGTVRINDIWRPRTERFQGWALIVCGLALAVGS